MSTRLTLAERFYGKVTIKAPSECWPWLSYKDKDGYGRISINGKYQRAHKIAWELHHGKKFPAGRLACHSCNHPWCVNPLHVYPDTPAGNIQYSHKLGRQKGGPYGGATRCKHGHLFTPENTILRKDGSSKRRCRICNQLAQQRYRRKLMERTDGKT